MIPVSEAETNGTINNALGTFSNSKIYCIIFRLFLFSSLFVIGKKMQEFCFWWKIKYNGGEICIPPLYR